MIEIEKFFLAVLNISGGIILFVALFLILYILFFGGDK